MTSQGKASAQSGGIESEPVRGFDRAARVAFGVGLLFAPWAPDALMTMARRPLPGLVLLVAAGVFADQAPRLREKNSPLYWACAVPFGAFVAVYAAATAVFAVDSVPGFGWALVAWTAPVAAFLASRRRRAAWAWHLVAMSFAATWAARVSPSPTLIVVAVGAYVAWGLVALLRRRVLAAPAPATLTLHAGAVASLLALYVYHQGVRPDLAPAIEAQKGARLLVTFDDGPAARALGSAYMSAARMGPDVVLGPGLPNRSLGVLVGGDGARVETLAIGRRVGDNVEADPADPTRFYMGTEDGVLVLRSEPAAAARTLPAPGGVVNFVRLFAPGRRLIVSRDNGRTVGRLPADEPGAAVETPPLGVFDTIFNVCVDERSARFFASVVGPSGWRVVEGDVTTMAWGRALTLPRSYGYFLENDAEKRRVYAASYHTGEVFTIDADSLTLLDRRRVGLNARNITWDAMRRRLYVSDAVAGELIAYNPDEGRVTARLLVGPLARQSTLDASGETLLLRSSAGIVELRPDAWTDAGEGEAPGGPTTGGVLRSLAVRFTMPWMIRLRSWLD